MSKKDISESNMDPTIEETILTKDGYEKLKEDLENLKNISRAEVAERIQIAISFGDLSENSEYEDAKREQAMMEGRIAELEQRLQHVKIIEGDQDSKKVTLGSKVQIVNKANSKDTLEFTIVGSMEFDPNQMLISNVSPIGKAVLGKKAKDVVKVKLPHGHAEYTIIKITN